jgi:kumamolisin
MASSHVRLKGSERPAKRGAVRMRDLAATALVEVTVTLRHPELPDPGKPMTRRQLEQVHAPSGDEVAAVKRVLGRYGLNVTDGSPVTGSLRVTGTAAQIESAFEPRLGLYRSDSGREFRGREGDVRIPRTLRGLVSGVFGLDQRRVARRRLRAAQARAGASSGQPSGPGELERRYRFPAGHGEGQTIAVAEFGGGYFPADLRKFCREHGRAVPHITAVPVGLQPLTRRRIAALPLDERQEARGESREVMMDVEIVAGLCDKARIDVLFAPFDQKGWIDLLDHVIALDPRPVSVSVSWGSAEDSSDWSPAARRAINHRLHVAALLGITVCAATGDDGSGDQMQDERGHVHFPASSPFVLAVGGTMLEGDREVVWWNSPGDRSERRGGSTGGGVSAEFPRPAWQRVRRIASINPDAIDGRIIPDVAALAGLPGYALVYGGRRTMNGGTSAAAPLWAALIARIASSRPDQAPAFIAPLLYRRGADGRVRGGSALRDVTHGHNTSPQPGRGYEAKPGYDAASGWGVPDGRALLASL